jgi:hypothetical protein
MVISGCWAYCLVSDVLSEGYHPQARAGALVVTDDGAAAVADGALNLCEGYCASGIAHGDDGEEQM